MVFVWTQQEDSKMYRNALYLEKFFDDQLKKLLPDYIMKKVGDSLSDGTTLSAKRPRLEDVHATEVIDVPDDDF